MTWTPETNRSFEPSLRLYEDRLKALKWSFKEAEDHYAMICRVAADERYHTTTEAALLEAMAKVARRVWLSHPDNPGWE